MKKLMLMILMSYLVQVSAIKIIVHTPYWDKDMMENHFFLKILEKKGFEVFCTKSLENLPKFDYLVCHELRQADISYLKKYDKNKLILIILESPVIIPASYDSKNHEYFGTVFTWNDALVDNNKYCKICFPYVDRPYHGGMEFEKRNLAVMILANKKSVLKDEIYTKRRAVIEFFEQHLDYDFALYGRGWESEGYATYKGEIQDKFYLLQHYKFCFAYENMENIDGWITEKIFDAMVNGVVPIYRGAQNIEKYIPKECYILESDFATLDDLYDYLVTMDKKTFNQYLKNIQKFMLSDQYAFFNHQSFMNLFLKRISFLEKYSL